MREIFRNKHLVNTIAMVVMYCGTLIVVGLVFWKAPEQAVQIMNTAVSMLGGAAVGSKLGLKI